MFIVIFSHADGVALRITVGWSNTLVQNISKKHEMDTFSSSAIIYMQKKRDFHHSQLYFKMGGK